MKKFWLLFLTIYFPLTLTAQDWKNEIFSKSLESVKTKNKQWYKGQILKKERNGMGFLKLKNENLYIGDFSKGEMTGYGMMLVPEGEKIPNCDGCIIYVGNWKNGRKFGIGTCYAENGDIIYSGIFEDDKPIGLYPSKDASILKYFSLFEYENGDKYLGEINNGYFNGFGVYIWEDGDLWFGNFKEGVRKGIGLYLMYDGEWETLDYNGDNCVQISSSINYRNKDASRKAATRQSFSAALGYFSAAAISAVETSNQIQEIQSGDSSSSGGNADYSSHNNNSSSTGASSSKNAKTSVCGYAWRRDSRTYSDWETQLIQMRTYPERYINSYTSDYADIQSKMRQIRQKWEARGCLITKSPHE